jgi:hypothetical protein
MAQRQDEDYSFLNKGTCFVFIIALLNAYNGL